MAVAKAAVEEAVAEVAEAAVMVGRTVVSTWSWRWRQWWRRPAVVAPRALGQGLPTALEIGEMK